jgi:PIN domain nuclease of toxin-antitoxin system
VLLDTHVWIWMVADALRQLGPRTRRRLARAAAAASGLSVSTASIFEIAALHTAGRLLFTQPVERWLRESIAAAGVRVLDLDASIAIDAGLIPAGTLADPVDRLLVATAREYQVPLVTRDRRILVYAERTSLVRVIDASV